MGLNPSLVVVVAQVDGLVRPQSPSNAEKSAAIIRSHSISGDLHGIHAPDPVAADILRKEPEQETYVKLNVDPIGASSSPTSPPVSPVHMAT